MVDEHISSPIADFSYVFGYICFLLGSACIVALILLGWWAGAPTKDPAPDANMGVGFFLILALIGISGFLSFGVLLSALAWYNDRRDWDLGILALLAIWDICVYVIYQGTPAFSPQKNPLSPISLALAGGVISYLSLVWALPLWKVVNRFGLRRHQREP